MTSDRATVTPCVPTTTVTQHYIMYTMHTMRNTRQHKATKVALAGWRNFGGPLEDQMIKHARGMGHLCTHPLLQLAHQSRALICVSTISHSPCTCSFLATQKRQIDEGLAAVSTEPLKKKPVSCLLPKDSTA